MIRWTLVLAVSSLVGLGGAVRGDLSDMRAAPADPASPIPGPQASQGPEYNGRFTYVRIQHGSDLRGILSYSRRGRGSRGEPPWSHDYPRAERNFARILDATTFVDTYMEGNAGRILTFDDPELFKYPMATIIEVGNWNPSDEEILGLRNYLLKGGFLIVDDTRGERGYELSNFVYQMNRALPDYQMVTVPNDHEIFNNFFLIEDPLALVPPYGRNHPVYLGIFEDNDPERGRLMVMINWNQDLQEYWEYSDQGYYPVDLSREAYQFGINYVIYGYTH